MPPVNALIRRVTENKTHGAIFRDVVNKKLGIDVYCGLPKDLHHRVSTVREEPALQAQMQVMLGNPDLPIYKSLLTIPKGAKKQEIDTSICSNDPNMWTTESSSAYTLWAQFMNRMTRFVANLLDPQDQRDLARPTCRSDGHERLPRWLRVREAHCV